MRDRHRHRTDEDIEAELFTLRRQRQTISERTRKLSEVLYKRRAGQCLGPGQREIMRY